jgi:hypothetical protein
MSTLGMGSVSTTTGIGSVFASDMAAVSGRRGCGAHAQ